jgi:DNA primase
MISKPTIARIIDSARIEEVVGDFLTLKKRGVNYIACCPFHNEKTPSFNVNPVRNIFKCFGCGKGGDSVNFVMEHEKLTYPEALRYLAKKYNIQIEEIYDRNIDEEKKLETERESLYVVDAFAQKYFTDILYNSNEGKSIGLSYFKERGLSDEIIQRFQLGYAPEGRTVFTDAATKAGYNLDYLVKAGLTIRVEDNSQEESPKTQDPSSKPQEDSQQPEAKSQKPARHYDRFAGRVMFPIHNVTGRVIGFGGRALRKDVKAKYVNSPESEIYHKSNVLYGMNVARKQISVEDNCFLVEGYMDVISMHLSGIENVVASSGTSLTVEQVRLIKRYTNNITIMYDGDPAGIKASFRGIDMILEEGLNVRAILFPEGDDPDSYSRKHSETELKDFIKAHTTDFIRFKTQLLYSDTDNDPIKKATLIQQIVESIALIPNSITRTVFIQECSKIMKMDEQALLTELNKALRKKYGRRTNEPNIEEIIDLDTAPVPQPIDTNRDSSEQNEKKIIHLMLSYGHHELEMQNDTEGSEVSEVHKISVAQFIHEHLSVDQIGFEHENYRKIFEEYSAALLAGETLSLEHFIHHQNPEISSIAIDLTTFPYTLSDWQKKHDIPVPKEEDALRFNVERAIYSLKIKHIMKLITETQKQLQEATSDEDIMILVAQKKKLDEAKNIFSKELGWVVLR